MRWRCGLFFVGIVRGLRDSGFLAAPEAAALAVHLHDMHILSAPVQQRAGEPFPPAGFLLPGLQPNGSGCGHQAGVHWLELGTGAAAAHLARTVPWNCGRGLLLVSRPGSGQRKTPPACVAEGAQKRGTMKKTRAG